MYPYISPYKRGRSRCQTALPWWWFRMQRCISSVLLSEHLKASAFVFVVWAKSVAFEQAVSIKSSDFVWEVYKKWECCRCMFYRQNCFPVATTGCIFGACTRPFRGFSWGDMWSFEVSSTRVLDLWVIKRGKGCSRVITKEF